MRDASSAESTGWTGTDLIIVEVEEALGPGLEFEHDPRVGLLGTHARDGDRWRGFDRAGLLDSDDGQGSRIPVLVATPTSTFRGCLLRVGVLGGWRQRHRVVLMAAVPGTEAGAVDDAAGIGGLAADATWFGPTEAQREIRNARHRFRERRSRDRVLGGRAWRPEGTVPLDDRRFTTPHSQAEYDLRRLPPRFLRGLDGLLDDDERLLYSVLRPWMPDAGILSRLRGEDRRAALLALTDRQLIWAVDHMQPDAYLSDMGIDTEVIPVERITSVTSEHTGSAEVSLSVGTGPGRRIYVLPSELAEEVEVMAALAARFAPTGVGTVPRRVYSLAAAPFDEDWAARFGQSDLARSLFARADVDEPLAFIFSPRRDGQRHAMAVVLASDQVVIVGEDEARRIPLATACMLQSTISPLIGRFAIGLADRSHAITYPAPLRPMGMPFMRLARRALANQAPA